MSGSPEPAVTEGQDRNTKVQYDMLHHTETQTVLHCHRDLLLLAQYFHYGTRLVRATDPVPLFTSCQRTALTPHLLASKMCNTMQ